MRIVKNAVDILKTARRRVFSALCGLYACKHIRKKLDCNSGVAALEASLTLPIVITMIFFILEMMKVNNTRTAVDSIALEATLEFISQKNTSNFNKIINKYKPGYIQRDNIDYYFTFYRSLDDMLKQAPYGNEEAYWQSASNYIDTDRNKAYTAPKNKMSISNIRKPENSFSASAESGDTCITGKVFVLTVVCNYKFSSSFVRKFFTGGANTVSGKNFIIWGRGVGICH